MAKRFVFEWNVTPEELARMNELVKPNGWTHALINPEFCALMAKIVKHWPFVGLDPADPASYPQLTIPQITLLKHDFDKFGARLVDWWQRVRPMVQEAEQDNEGG